jgi:hypothetical protein
VRPLNDVPNATDNTVPDWWYCLHRESLGGVPPSPSQLEYISAANPGKGNLGSQGRSLLKALHRELRESFFQWGVGRRGSMGPDGFQAIAQSCLFPGTEAWWVVNLLVILVIHSIA